MPMTLSPHDLIVARMKMQALTRPPVSSAQDTSAKSFHYLPSRVDPRASRRVFRCWFREMSAFKERIAVMVVRPWRPCARCNPKRMRALIGLSNLAFSAGSSVLMPALDGMGTHPEEPLSPPPPYSPLPFFYSIARGQ